MQGTEYPRVASHDDQHNTAYIAFKAIPPGGAVSSRPIYDDAGGALLVVDLSATGELLGIELLDAARQLPEVYRKAKQ